MNASAKGHLRIVVALITAGVDLAVADQGECIERCIYIDIQYVMRPHTGLDMCQPSRDCQRDVISLVQWLELDGNC